MEDRLAEDSLRFSINVIQFCDNLECPYFIKDQLMRAATSIGANIREAKYAHGKADFAAKLKISLKECNETEYWLDILIALDNADKKTTEQLRHDAGSLRFMLIKSLTTLQANMKQN